MVNVDWTIQRKPSLREQVLRSLEHQLFSGQVVPGDTLSVPALADQFGVSATPVREAVLELVRRDLLEILPSKGYRVVDTPIETIRETVEVRRLLEVPATKRAAELATAQELDHLHDMAIETVRLAESQDLEQFVTVDHDFHLSVLSPTGNSTLVHIIETLRDRARVHIAGLVRDGLWTSDVAQEHVDLVAAMRAHDMEEVERIVLLHMSYSLAGCAQQA